MGLIVNAKVVVSSHFGELIQGPVLVDDHPVTALVSLPSPNLLTTMHLGGEPDSGVRCRAMTLWHDLHQSVALPVEQYPQRMSSLPIGRGLGTSTADLFATRLLFAQMTGQSVSRQKAFDDIRAYESASDPIHLGGPVLFFPTKGQVFQRLPKIGQPLYLVGTYSKSRDAVQTEDLVYRPYTDVHVAAFNEARCLLTQALLEKNIRDLAAGCAMSADANSDFVQLTDLKLLSKEMARTGALGFNISHSGTAIGFMFETADARDAAGTILDEMDYQTLRFQSEI